MSHPKHKKTDNEAVVEKVYADVLKTFFPEAGHSEFSHGPLEMNDFSSCFWLTSTRFGDFYVKIPKTEIQKNRVGDISHSDRDLAKAEYESLMFLKENWGVTADDVIYVEPVGYLEKHNAIVTKRVFASNILLTLRRTEIAGKLGCRKRKINEAYMAKVGRSLSNFHQQGVAKETADIKREEKKISEKLSELHKFGVNERYLAWVSGEIADKVPGIPAVSNGVKTLKGLDVRNLFLSPEGGLRFLDPGRLKYDLAEADIARFLVTVRIIYWGTNWFWLRLKPSPETENALISGYYGKGNKNESLLHFYVLKELVKHWRMAHYALSLKPWPRLLKKILARFYIDRFYRKEIADELAKI